MWLKRRLLPAAAELALAFTGLILGYVVIGTLAAVVRPLLGSLGDTPVVGLVGGPLITVIAALAYGFLGARVWATQDIRPEPEAERASAMRTVSVVAIAMLAALGGSVLLGIFFDAIGQSVEEQGGVLEIVDSARAGEGWRDAILLCVSALLIAPAAEEVLFRGLLFRRIRTVSGLPLAHAVSAIAFAAIHDNPAGFAVYAWLGVCFAIALQRTGRLSAAIAVHMGNNAFVLANLFLA